MSVVPSLEPQANGLIVLKTTFGDLEIELFTQQCPKATRNFVQLCLDGYYNGTIFDRVEKDFIAIGGVADSEEDELRDKVETFKDEFHSRLRFSRRGLLATANTQKDENGPDFFFTLGPTPELQNKHTIFGRLRGDSVYHLVDLNECQVDEDSYPLSEKRILEVNVIENPYPELTPRKEFARNIAEKDSNEDSEYDPLSRPKPVINKKLSFHPDSDEDDDESDTSADKRSQTITTESVKIDDLKQEPKNSRTSDDPNVGDDASVDPSEDISSDKKEDKERRLREIRAKIDAMREQLMNKPEIGPDETYGQDELNDVIRTNTNDATEHDTSAINETNTRNKKDCRRERDTSELIDKFKKKLKKSRSATRSDNNVSRIPTQDMRKKMNMPADLDEPVELDLDLLDSDAWLHHKFEAKDDESDYATGTRHEDDYSSDDRERTHKSRSDRDRRSSPNEYRRERHRSHHRDYHHSRDSRHTSRHRNR